jgi:hypothetical protein
LKINGGAEEGRTLGPGIPKSWSEGQVCKMRSTSAISTAAAKSRTTIGRHSARLVAKAVLIGVVPPLMLMTEANPGLPMEVFDQIRAGLLADRSQF